MTPEEVSSEINRLFAAFPSLRMWFARMADEDAKGLEATWNRQLAKCEAEDVVTVVDEIVDGVIELPPNYEYDRTCVMIRREAGKIRASRRERNKLSGLTRRTPGPPDQARRFRVAMTLAMRSGPAALFGIISGEENERNMREIYRYHRDGGEAPQVLTESQIQELAREQNALGLGGVR